MKVLVTGGTGFIGSNLVERLIKEGHEVRCLVRKTSNLSFLNSSVELIYGDIKDISSVERALDGVEVVYHIAGILGRWGIPEETYWQTHVNGTKNVLDAILKRDIERFVHCSTAGVLAAIEKLPADETYPYNPSNIYEITKTESEKLVFEYYDKYGIPTTVIRPELVYGQRDLHTLSLFKAIKKGFFPIIGTGNNTWHPVYIDDLIKAFALCVNSSKAIGEVYLIGGERYVTIKEVTTDIANALGVHPPRIYIPVRLANIMAIMMESSAKILNFDPPITKSRVKFLTESRGSTSAKAKRDLGYTPSIGLEEGIKKTVEWYQTHGLL